MKALLALAAVSVLLGAGCTTTVQRTAEPSPVVCGFLGADLCAELKPGAREEAGLRYVNPKGMFTQYDKVMIVVVGFFGGDPAKVSPKDEQRFTDLFYKNLHEALATRYQVVDEVGPGVMKVEVALLDVEATTPGSARSRWWSPSCGCSALATPSWQEDTRSRGEARPPPGSRTP